MDNEDKILEEFFQKMKEKDQKHHIPSFERLKLPKNVLCANPYRLAAAAIIILLIVASALLTLKPKTESIDNFKRREIGISNELVSWEEPTKSLLEDF